MSKHIKILLLFFSVTASLILCCPAQADLSNLIAIARSQAAIQEEGRRETKSYKAVKKALDDGSLAQGATKDSILRKYGEPVVSLPDKKRQKEKWIYKPAGEDHFGGAQVQLFFDDNGMLDEIVGRPSKSAKSSLQPN